MQSHLKVMLDSLPSGANILDAGGWFQPLNRATHVVDWMPYETRRGRLSLARVDDECFSKDTWFQADFCSSTLRLPFEDRYFDFCTCTQTLEDLSDPEPLLRELRRVAKSGYFETPSRLAEQTTGVRDRITTLQGHPHHHWILDGDDGCIEFSPKKASLPINCIRHVIPLIVYEREVHRHSAAQLFEFAWSETFGWRIVSAEEGLARATAFAAGVHMGKLERRLDTTIRRLRGLKWRILGPTPVSPERWWADMLELSRPYSKIQI